MPLSRRALLVGVPALLGMPRAAHAQPPHFRLAVRHLARTDVGPDWHVRVRVTIHNDSGRTTHVETGCWTVFTAVGGCIRRPHRQMYRGMDERIRVCSPARPAPVPLPAGPTSEIRTYVFESPPRNTRGLEFFVRGTFDGAAYESNHLRL